MTSFWKRLLTVGVASVVACLLALGVAEIGLRLAGPGRMRLQHQRIILPENRSYTLENTHLRGVDPTVQHTRNSLGFRGAEPPPDFSQCLTVVAVGGSTTEGFYLSDGQTWPEVAGARLARTLTKVWTNNAGLDGHSTHGHLLLVRDFLVQLRPKVVLLLVGLNDVGRADLVPFDREFIRANRDTRTWQKASRWLEDRSRAIAWLQNLARTWAAWRRGLLHRSVDPANHEALDLPEGAVQAAVHTEKTRFISAYRARLQQIVELCRQHQILPVLLTQPALYGDEIDDATGADLGRIQTSPGHNGHLDWALLDAYNQATSEVAAGNDVPLIDLARQVPKSSRYYYDFVHFTRDGAAMAGDKVAESLTPILAQRFPQFVTRH